MDPNDDQKVNGGILHDPTEQTGSPEHLHGLARTHRDHQERDHVCVGGNKRNEKRGSGQPYSS
jgi:hypothetical protein